MSTPEDIDRLAADWIALWEGETAALAQDRELAEGWAAGGAHGSRGARPGGAVRAAGQVRAHDHVSRRGAPARWRCT
jgi:hypothetical protein